MKKPKGIKILRYNRNQKVRWASIMIWYGFEKGIYTVKFASYKHFDGIILN